jgi:hypothetical protein
MAGSGRLRALLASTGFACLMTTGHACWPSPSLTPPDRVTTDLCDVLRELSPECTDHPEQCHRVLCSVASGDSDDTCYLFGELEPILVTDAALETAENRCHGEPTGSWRACSPSQADPDTAVTWEELVKCATPPSEHVGC